MHKERKETTHREIGENVITTSSNIYDNNEYKVCYYKVVTRPMYKNNVSKRNKSKNTKSPHYIPQRQKHSP